MIILETNRLYLRKIQSDDYDAICSILQNVDVMYAWEHSFSDREVSEWIDENIMRYDRDGYSYWAVIEKDTNQLIGVTGLIAEQADDERYVGIGYIYNKSYWKMGYAFEGANACVNYAFETLHMDEVTAQIRPDNLSSRKVAEKLGMTIKKEFIRSYRGREMIHLLYSRTDKRIITAPLTDEAICTLKCGDSVYISGKIYTGRDAAHKRLTEMIIRGEQPPFDFKGQIIYYAGPSPSRPGRIIGSIGPTTAGRMDVYSPLLIENGLKAMIGKGPRNAAVVEHIVKHNGVYFAAIGGAAALMSRCVKSARLIAFEDLGTEAIRELVVEEMPVIVAVDCSGNSIYK